MEREQENIRGQTEVWRVREEIDEATVLERRIGLSDDDKPISVRELPFSGKESVEKERDFEVRPSNHLANDGSGACSLICSRLCAATPARRETCLFPYKNVKRQFPEDELFALVAFDRLALRNMYIQNHFRCQLFLHMLDGYQSLTSEELSQALLKNERRRQGCIP
ncbi:hypothetical protein JG688_00014858 [Phytophthora aleatoria]|uniref:Uncharacterized protein n=1 Tax=Phytophthora aleatoria TaxID=2496075 RepID=A0A8J5I6R9_9STRA|nr:hypothetical protein JG688_00014858 [Phytophthora aleatoria]